ncbi:MAG: hypothetical protein ABI217_05990 [Chthoniobacterales bacterium]
MPSSTSNFERVIPARPWRGITVSVVLLLAVAAVAWEIHCRSLGYGPTLNDSEDLWAKIRRQVEPESIVIIGDSRAIFDLDLDALEHGLGKRPLQLAQPGSCAYPVLHDFAKDTRFHGTIICSLVPRLFFAPPQAPPYGVAQKALQRYHDQTYSRRVSLLLAMPLEENVAFLKQDDLTLGQLLDKLPIPNRPYALAPPNFPPYFATLDRERRARMIERCAQPGPLQTRVKTGWIPLFSPPPPPTFIPHDAFIESMQRSTKDRFQAIKSDLGQLRERGAKIVFVRFPMSGELKALENKLTPRAAYWDRLLKETAAPGIHFEDYPELAGFTCPEWSHLSAGDSVEFTKRLVPHLRAALSGAILPTVTAAR